MYEISVQRQFRASHAITIAGRLEERHDHVWHVTLVAAGNTLDADGLLCDFHIIERKIDLIIGDLNERDLNATEPFDRLNPTAEQVARYIAERTAEALKPDLDPWGGRVSRVTVTEEPGCAATYWMD